MKEGQKALPKGVSFGKIKPPPKEDVKLAVE